MSNRSFTATSGVWILSVCLCLPICSAGLMAQSAPASHFIFTHFVSFAGESAGLAVFNPNPEEATVTLTLRWPDGRMVAGVPNPATLTVPARGQVAKTAGELFATAADLDASLEISSSLPGLAAYYQTFDPAVTFLDGGDALEASTSLVFPVIPGPAEGISEIDFMNPNARETAVELKLWSFQGRLLGTATISVPAGGHYRNLTSNVFPAGTDFQGASHITTTSKPRNVLSAAQSVAGTSLFAGFSSRIPPGGFIDLASLNALPVTRTSNSGVIPFFHTGGMYASTLSLANIEPAAVNVTVTAVGNNGSNLGTQAISLNPQGGLRAPLQNIITALGSGEQEGWLLIQASGRITGAIIHGRSDEASLTAVPMQKTPKAEFVIAQIVQGYGSYTDVSLVNPTPNTSNAEIRVVDTDGSTVAAGQIAIGPSKRVSLPLDQLLPEVVSQYGGVLHIRSNEALFATATIWSNSGSTASNFAPQDTSFVPAPMTSFALTGRVLVNDKPVEGFRVVLSGPVGKLALSAEDGSYRFTDLPAGKYSMMVDQFGFQFAPAQASIEITSASRRQDFLGFTAGDTILVQPAALPVGSPDTTVAIFGANFNSTSEAFIDATRLDTTFVDSTQVQAVLPSYRTASPSTFDITVVTNGSDDASRRVSQPYRFVAYQDRPVLKSVTSSGNIVEGSPGGSLTLEGTGFLEGAHVKVNGLSDGIQATVVDDTKIVAYLPASYFEYGGIYPVTVENPYPANVESNLQLLTVYYPPPVVDTVLPRSCPVRLEANAAPLDIGILGYGFRRGAVVLFNDIPLVTSYCETDAYCLTVHLYAKIPAELLRSAGFAKIEVRNPDPSLANSEATYLPVEGLKPTITSVQPGSATLLNTPFEFAMPIIVEGTNFGPQTLVRVYQAGADLPDFDQGKVEIVSTTQLMVSVSMRYPDSLGEWIVQVANPTPGGGISDSVSFFITEESFVSNPFLISLNPQTVAVGGPAFTLTINGMNFKTGTVVYFNTVPLSTTVLSSLQVKADVPASLIRSAGRVPISVTNPDMGGTSNRLFLDIR